MNLGEIQKNLAEIYPNSDIPLEFEVNKVIANCGLIAANYEKGAADSSPYIESLAWTMSIFSRNKVEFWRRFLQKFPNCCPLCLELPCICEVTKKLPRRVSVSRRRMEVVEQYETIIPSMEMNSFGKDEGAIPRTAAPPLLDQIVDMLRAIYLVNDTIHRHNPDFFFVKISKSCGRLASALTRSHSDGNRERILDELISLQAWLLAFWRLEFRHDPSFSETEQLVGRFQHGCPSCGRIPCNCGDSRFSKVTAFEIVNQSAPSADAREIAIEQLRAVNRELEAANLEMIPEEEVTRGKSSLLEAIEGKVKIIQAIEKGTAATQKILGRLGALSEYVENWIQ